MDELKNCLLPLTISCSPLVQTLNKSLATHPSAQYFNVLHVHDSVRRAFFGERKEDHFSAMVNLSLQASIYRLPPTSILKLCKQGFVTSKVKWKKREMPLKHQTDLGSNILKKSDGGGTWIERVAKELRMSVSERITNWKDIMREGTPATITQMMQSLLSYIISFETEIDTKDLKGLKVQIRIPLT